MLFFSKDGGLHAIYDVTIGYPDKMPEKEQDIIDGNLPNEIHFHVKRSIIYGNFLHGNLAKKIQV